MKWFEFPIHAHDRPLKTLGSLFAGIGGIDLAFEQVGFETVWQVEIDDRCRKLLEQKFPRAKRFEDVRKCGENLERVDIVAGGFPCTDLSIAAPSRTGARLGLSGARSGLFYEQCRIIDAIRPFLVVWENVAGLSTANAGRDMLRVVAELGKINYFGACRLLDAQYFGVAQRRRRWFGVFADGNIGAECATEILSLTEGMRGNPAPGKESRKRIAPTLSARTSGGGGFGTDFDLDGGLVEPADYAPTLAPSRTARDAKGERQDIAEPSLISTPRGVRRLTPTECEKLQGFPVGWTDGFSDSVRYKMLGNSVAVPNVRWIAERIRGHFNR